jgi:alkane 1-monooxygenase
MVLFASATLAPIALLMLGTLRGGGWILAGLAMITAFTWAADRLMRRRAAVTGDQAEFPSGDGLAVLLAGLLLAGLVLVLRATGAPEPQGLRLPEALGLVIGWGLAFGQIGHPAAHELIHRRAGWKRALGRAVYVAVLMGHHASSHLRVHHQHVGTPEDPASAPLGMGFWHYVPRAWAGSFMAGLRAETALRARARVAPPRWSHPYVGYALGAGLMLGLALWLGGPRGLAMLAGIAAYAQGQILLSDYVQHYGLRRARLADGRLEPVGPRHAWNAPQPWSGAMMLNAPRHSDHHAHPGRPYPALRLEEEMPLLPRSLRVMGAAALIPPLWRRMMDRRARRWNG